MKTTDTKTYIGIDYGHGQSNIDKATGIRFGVISQNSVNPEAFDDIWQNSRDLSHEHAVSEFKTRLERTAGDCQALADVLDEIGEKEQAVELFNDWDDHSLKAADFAEYVWAEIEQSFNDRYEDNGERDWLYEADGYKLTNCLTSDVMVLASPYFTHAQFCSPCVPGACNLDSPLGCPTCDNTGVVNSATNTMVDDTGERPCKDCDGTGFDRFEPNKCFCLGHDWFDGGKAPYPVYSVKTGELVNPE